MLAALSSTKGKQDNVYKGSWKTGKTRDAWRSKLLIVGSTFFRIFKGKMNGIGFSSVFQNLNTQLKHKPYIMSEFREILLNLESFQYAMSLELNIGY